MKTPAIFFAALWLAGCATSTAPTQKAAAPLSAERLGYPADTKLLIVHADDLGMAHSINSASIAALKSGLVNSASIMVPCPWFPEIATWARANPDADLGLHLTLTAEWTPYRWGPVLSRDRVPSLLDETGYLYITEDRAAAAINPREAEAEIRAQIDRAISFGIRPTHLDSHMGTLYQTAELFEVFLRVGREYKLPVRIPTRILDRPELAALVRHDDVVVTVADINQNVPAEGWAAFYTNVIRNLLPGVTEIIIHLAYDDAEMQAMTFDHPDWGAAWRQRDYDFFTSEQFRRLLQENNVKLVTWRELGRLR